MPKMRSLGNDEAFIGHLCSIGVVFTVVVGGGVFLIPHIRQSLEKEQRKDVLLVIARINQATQNGGGAPEEGFQFLPGVSLMTPPLAPPLRGEGKCFPS